MNDTKDFFEKEFIKHQEAVENDMKRHRSKIDKIGYTVDGVEFGLRKTNMHISDFIEVKL